MITERMTKERDVVVNSCMNNQRSLLVKKPIRCRIDYNFFNYCATCNLKYSKEVLRCPDCKQKVRTRPWHRSKVVQVRRI